MSTPQTATETLEAYKALGEKVETLAGAYEQALVALKEAQRQRGIWEKDAEVSAERLNAIDELRATLTEVRAERDAALTKAEAWRKMHSEALGETTRARDDLSIALRALDASREALKTLGVCGPPCVREAPQEPEFLPGDLARGASDTRPDSAFWPPVVRVDGDTIWLRYTQDEVNCKPETVVRKPVIAGDYVRVWRGPAQGIRGRVEGYGDGGALRINSTDWVNLTDVVAVKP